MNEPTYKSSILQVKAYRILQSQVSGTLAIYNLNSTEWSILGLIVESANGIRHSEIAKILNVETPLITMLVNELVEKELVERHAHPKDKRAKLLFLTHKGRNFLPKIEKALRDSLIPLLKGISKEDLESYRRVLQTIVLNESQSKNLVDANQTNKGGE